jgi:mRNA interferase RelE/StbE
LTHSIVYKASVQRDLKRISKTEVSHILNQVEQELAANTDAHPALKGEFAGLRRFRVGDYRVIYAILGQEVLVLRIGHRKDVYQKGF